MARRSVIPLEPFEDCAHEVNMRTMQDFFERTRNDLGFQIEGFIDQIPSKEARKELRAMILDYAEACVAAGSVKERKGR